MEWSVENVNIDNMKHHSDIELKEFLENQTTQLPPKYSAIHIEGKRAYDLIRKWKEFDIPQRPISVTDIEIIEQNHTKITIKLTISAGGYIRSFAPIIAEFFGVPGGGCITYLHREKIGNIDLTRSMGFEDLNIDHTIPYGELFPNIAIYPVDPIYQKPLIDGLILDIGTPAERRSNREILISCGDIISLGKWTMWGIEVIRNYV